MNISFDVETLSCTEFPFFFWCIIPLFTALQELSTTTRGDFVGPGASLKVTQTIWSHVPGLWETESVLSAPECLPPQTSTASAALQTDHGA